MLDSVEEALEDADEVFSGAEAGQGSAEDAMAASDEELVRAQSTVLMASFEARLQERDVAVQEQLRSQLEAILHKQELAHERMLLTLSAQRTAREPDAAAQRPVAAAPSVDINPRLVLPAADDFTTPAAREIPMQKLMTSPLQALRSGALAMAGTQRRTSFGKVFDLNSSGGTTASQSPSVPDQEPRSAKPAATAVKDDESYVAEYYARAQLANAKMVRQYKTRIEELKRSSFPSIVYYLKLLIHTGGKCIGFTARRLSWAEICLVAMLLRQFAPYAHPYLAPLLHAVRHTVIDYLLAIKQNSVASLRAAIATGLAGLTAMVSQRSTTHAQELIAQRELISAQMLALKEQLAQAQAAVAAAAPAVTDEPADPPVGKFVFTVGNISAAVLSVLLQGNDTALCDDGATIDCFLTIDGAIPGTHDSSQGGSLTVGDKKSSLASHGVYLYAIERCGSNGLWQDELFLGHHTPNGVANIMSEAREVNVRKSRLEWCPGMARQFHTKTGTTMPLVMGSNGLGFLRIRPITDHSRIVRLLRQSALTPPWLLKQVNAHSPAVLTSSMSTSVTTAPSRALVDDADDMPRMHDVSYDKQAVTFMPASTTLGPPAHVAECLRLPVPVGVAAPTLARQLAGATTLKDSFVLAAIGANGIDFDGFVMAITAASMALSGVGVAGKLPTLAPLDVLMRVHCILGHASLDVCLATIAFATTLPKGFITKEAIKEYIAAKCGICESAKMRRRTFCMDISGVTDNTIPEIGKSYVFDTLGLHVPCAQWAYVNITRFSDRNPKGIKRSLLLQGGLDFGLGLPPLPQLVQRDPVGVVEARASSLHLELAEDDVLERVRCWQKAPPCLQTFLVNCCTLAVNGSVPANHKGAVSIVRMGKAGQAHTGVLLFG